MGKRIDFEVPPGARESECRSCGASIVWIRSGSKPDGSAKWMPLCLSTAQRDADTGETRALSHFATCPEAKKHRAPRPAQKTWTV